MKFTGDYHLHTRVSDGKADIKDHVRVAKERGLDEIVISDHSFCSLFYHATEEKLKAQREEIDALADCGVRVLQGIEGNLIGNEIDVPHSVIRKLDVLTVGFHRFITPSEMKGQSKFLLVNGFGTKKANEKLVRENTEAYVNVIENYPIDIVAHLGHRAPVDFERVCECAVKNNVYIELNAKHLDAIEKGIESAIATGVKFIVGSDAHSEEKTGEFIAVEEFMTKHNIPIQRVYGVNGNQPIFKDKKEWTYGRDV